MNRIPNSEPDKDTIKFQVGKFKGAIEAILKNLDGSEESGHKKSASGMKEIENSSAKLFEEIKIMFQDLPSRIERTSSLEGRKRKRRLHPAMIDEIIHITKNPKIGIRMALSLYRERMPWIYDEGIILLNKLETSKVSSTNSRIFKEFEELLMVSTRNPLIEEFISEDKDDFVLFMELPRVILRALHQRIFE